MLKSYIAQGMHVFVAKVNLERHKLSGRNYLSPLQVSYKSSKFMLPIRLGTLPARFDAEAQTLAGLTGWDVALIRARMADGGEVATL